MSIAISRKVQKQLGIYIFLGKKILISDPYPNSFSGRRGPPESTIRKPVVILGLVAHEPNEKISPVQVYHGNL